MKDTVLVGEMHGFANFACNGDYLRHWHNLREVGRCGRLATRGGEVIFAVVFLFVCMVFGLRTARCCFRFFLQTDVAHHIGDRADICLRRITVKRAGFVGLSFGVF